MFRHQPITNFNKLFLLFFSDPFEILAAVYLSYPEFGEYAAAIIASRYMKDASVRDLALAKLTDCVMSNPELLELNNFFAAEASLNPEFENLYFHKFQARFSSNPKNTLRFLIHLFRGHFIYISKILKKLVKKFV